MTDSIESSSAFEKMDSAQKSFLTSSGYAQDPSVVDCDSTKRTITFLIDGEKITKQKTEVFSRVMGYHRPVENWNIGKRQEFSDRKCYGESPEWEPKTIDRKSQSE